MLQLVLVMTGGAAGALLRYLVVGAVGQSLGPAFPWGTLTVNLAGGFAMGLLVGFLARSGMGEPWRLFAGVGILGGFTTFSAFGLESWTLFDSGQAGVAAAYILASVAGAILLTGLGLWIARA